MKDLDKFILALKTGKKIKIKFKVNLTNALISRECIPIDYYKYKKSNGVEEGYKYRVWDCHGDKRTTLSIKDFEIKNIDLLNQKLFPSFFNLKLICCIVAVLILIVIIILILVLVK